MNMNVHHGKRIVPAILGGAVLATALFMGQTGPAVGQVSPPGPPVFSPPIFFPPPTMQIDQCSEFFDNDFAFSIFCAAGGPGFGGDGGNGGFGGPAFSGSGGNGGSGGATFGFQPGGDGGDGGDAGIAIGGSGAGGGDGGDGHGGDVFFLFFGFPF